MINSIEKSIIPSREAYRIGCDAYNWKVGESLSDVLIRVERIAEEENIEFSEIFKNNFIAVWNDASTVEWWDCN